MIYEYHCKECDSHFDVVKLSTQIAEPETCKTCQTIATRLFVPSRVYFSKTKVTFADYNPGLGKVIHSERHMLDECKRNNLTPIGNDYVSGDKLQTKFEQDREAKHAQGWEDVKKDALCGLM